jgi:lysophospholipase L1-like esterase
MKYIFLLACLLLSNVVKSQVDNPYDLEKFSFIKYEKNKILFPGDSTLFYNMFPILDSILLRGEGKLEIVHIGGSHIQADVYTQQMRERFQWLGHGINGSRGMIFPYDVAKTNNPSNYKVYYSGNWTKCKNTQSKANCDLGLMGMSVTTADSNAWIHINLNGYTSVKHNYNKVRIYYEVTDSMSYIPVPGDTYPYNKQYFTEEYGFVEYELDTFNTSFTMDLAKTDSLQNTFTLLGIYFFHDDAGITYNSVGVNGAKLDSYLRCSYFSQHMASINPNLVILSIGTNDAYTRNFDARKFKLEYAELIRRIKFSAPQTAILITVPNDSYLYKRYVNKNTEKQEKIILELAKEYNLAVWNFYEIMGGLNSSLAWYYTKIMKYDRVHFNRRGYLLKGDLLFNAFLDCYDNSLRIKNKNSNFKNQATNKE